MKNFYIAVSVEENEKYYAYVVKITESDNLKYKFDNSNLVCANIFPTKKRADEVAQHWNACFKANGTYLFDEPKF